MAALKFELRARVSTERSDLIRPVLARLFPDGLVREGGDPKEFLVEGRMEGASARDLNRALLTTLRQAEKRTRLRSEWTVGGTTERFFDYVPKGSRPASAERAVGMPPSARRTRKLDR
ncbi:MAG: hypothetical protein ACLPZM_07370 [Thermoplasmata archaeon]